MSHEIHEITKSTKCRLKSFCRVDIFVSWVSFSRVFRDQKSNVAATRSVRGGTMSLTRPKLGPDTYVTAVIAFEFVTFSTSKLTFSERRDSVSYFPTRALN